MNEWLKKIFAKAKELWSKWKPIQKVIIIGIIIVVLVAIVAAARMSSKPSEVRLFNAPVSDENNLTEILDRLDTLHIEAHSRDNYIYVKDDDTKRRVVALLNDEGLIPSNVDIWSDFFTRSWSETDSDQNVKLKLKKTQALEKFIESYHDVQRAVVSLEIPEPSLFKDNESPVKCSVIITAKRGSDLLTNKKRVKGLHDSILAAVERISPENLIISNSEDGKVVNDFEAMADFDSIDLAAKQRREIQSRETALKNEILKALQSYNGNSSNRVRDLIVRVEMDFSKESSDETVIKPVEIRPDKEETPFDDSEYKDSLAVSSQTVTREYTQRGLTPEGPEGVQGQTPPVYSDLSNTEGHSVETATTVNNRINEKHINRVEDAKTTRITAAINIDGKWSPPKKDPNNPKKFLIDPDTGYRIREYTPLTEREIDDYTKYLRAAIGAQDKRHDLVTVTSIPYDRTEEFNAIDEAWQKQKDRALIIALSLAGILFILIGFIIFRIISKEIERRRREREARQLAEQQRERERKLWEAREEGMEVSMSVEETRRMELQENAITMAKEHPEDVAMLIRTWLMEE